MLMRLLATPMSTDRFWKFRRLFLGLWMRVSVRVCLGWTLGQVLSLSYAMRAYVYERYRCRTPVSSARSFHCLIMHTKKIYSFLHTFIQNYLR